MRNMILAASAVALSLQMAGPAAADDFFNPNTMLGWRQQTSPAAMAYVRAPIGPPIFKARAHAGFAVVGPRSYRAGEAPRYSQGPRLADVAFTTPAASGRWTAQLNVGRAVAWTSDPDSLKPGQVHLMESGLSWVAVGAITVGLAAATFGIIDQDAAP